MIVDELLKALNSKDTNIKKYEVEAFILLVGGKNLMERGLPAIGTVAKAFVKVAPLLNPDVIIMPVSLDRINQIAGLVSKVKTDDSLVALKGMKGKDPLYVALCELLTPSVLHGRYEQLMAKLIMAWCSIKNNELTLSGPLYRACSAAMVLAHHESVLLSFPDHRLSDEQYIEKLNAIKNEFDSTIKKRIGAITYLLRRALISQLDGIKRTGGGTRTSGSLTQPGTLPDAKVKQARMDFDFDRGVDGIEEPNIDYVRMASVNANEAKLAAAHGACPDEVTSRKILTINAYNKKNPMGDRSLKDHVRLSQGALHGIAMNNQLLPIQWGNLNPLEVEQLLSDACAIFESETQLRKKVSNQEGAALLMIMFWFGLDSEKAIGAQYIEKKADLNGSYAYCMHWHQWFVPAVKNDYKESITAKATNAARPLTNYLGLKVPYMAANILDQWIALNKFPQSKSALFKNNTAALEKWLSKFVKWHNKKHHGRITKSRISSYLFKEVSHSFSGDIVDASIIVGNVHYLADTMLFYTARSTQSLRDIYESFCADVEALHQAETSPMTEIVMSSHYDPGLFDNLFDDQDELRYIGSRYCPLEREIQKFVTSMKNRLQYEKKRYDKDRNSLLALHERYTIYTAEMLLFASGYRAVRSPLRCSFELDWESGLLCINDKDNEDDYNSRLVWLPSACISQLEHYQSHINRMASYLLHLDRGVFDTQKNQYEFLMRGIFPDKKAERISRKKQAKGMKVKMPDIEYSKWLPLLFFLTDKGQCELRPATLSPLVKSYFPLPLNANRHFMRSKLRESSCSSEIIRNVLGHWEAGQEPWSIYSGEDPWHFRKELQRFWEPVFAELGWEVLSGIE